MASCNCWSFAEFAEVAVVKLKWAVDAAQSVSWLDLSGRSSTVSLLVAIRATGFEDVCRNVIISMHSEAFFPFP